MYYSVSWTTTRSPAPARCSKSGCARAVSEDRLKLLDGRIRHPDHGLRLPQSLLALHIREALAPLQPVLVCLEAVYEVPDTHGARLYLRGDLRQARGRYR